MFTGLNRASRFYAADTVTPDEIAADVGAQVFTASSNYVPNGGIVQTSVPLPLLKSTSSDNEDDKGMTKAVYNEQPQMQ